jgi:type I restriction enzyme M protein
MDGFQDKVAFIWSVADLLRGDYKQSEYGRVILPLTVIRRLDCVLEPTKAAVLAKAPTATGALGDAMLYKITGARVYNRSPLTMEKLRDDPANVAGNLLMYVAGFNESVHDVLVNRFKLDEHITRLDEAGLLYQVVSKFCTIDLHPAAVPNIQMGYVFEELIRRFSEQSNETAGEHFTPREVIRLMVNLLLAEDEEELSKPGRTATLYDCACGTGGMLSVAEDHLRELNPKARLEVFGQELNDETYAVCVSDMLLKGQMATNIHPRNSFTHDGLPGERFDYMLANPPLRDQESVPLGENVGEYMAREVLPWVADAWVDESKTKIGYEIPLTRHFYKYTPPRPMEEIDAEIKALEAEIQELLGEVPR